MTAALGALHHEGIRPGRDGLAGLLGVGDRHPDVDARRLQAGHVGPRRTAERERDDRDALGDRELELVVPAVVVEARLAEGDAEPLRLVSAASRRTPRAPPDRRESWARRRC